MGGAVRNTSLRGAKLIFKLCKGIRATWQTVEFWSKLQGIITFIKGFLQLKTEKAQILSLIFVIMNTEQDTKARLAILKERLKERYPIVSMAFFGSYARNEQSAKSDLDVMVEFNGKMGSNFIDMALEMEQFLGVKVDLVSKNGIKEKYFKSIEPDLVYV